MSVNWSDPLDWNNCHGTATRLPLEELLLELPSPEPVLAPLLVELLAPMPLDDELLLPGEPLDALELNVITAN